MANKKTQDLQSLVKMLQDKFPNFLLGLTVLLVVILFLSLFLKKNHTISSTNTSTKTVTKTGPKNNWMNNLTKFFAKKSTPTPTPEQRKTYQVKQGDYLWKIAEKTYGSGFNAYDIATANQIKNPDLIEPGQELILPSVAPNVPTRGETVMGSSTGKAIQRPHEYVIKKGDYLWKIAQVYYGDGNQWVKIAHANNLAHPNLIFSGNKLALP